jgi:short-subunit dehydrogenase
MLVTCRHQQTVSEMRCDLTIIQDTRRVVDKTIKRFSALHVLVYNVALDLYGAG